MENENTQYQEVLITHFVLHIGNKAHAKSITKQLDKSIKNGTPGLVHGLTTVPSQGDGQIRFILPEAKTSDGKKIKYILPPGGAKIVPGKDLLQKIKADQKKLAVKSRKI
jgi:hypothetical protein